MIVASCVAPRRVVLDTNVVLSLYVFDDSRLTSLKRELEAGRWLALSNADCLAEYRRVLGYSQFGLSEMGQATAMAAYHDIVEDLSGISPSSDLLPVCSDRDDQMFLELARDGGADYLVSADRALLKLARHKRLRPDFRILTPDAAVALIAL